MTYSVVSNVIKNKWTLVSYESKIGSGSKWELTFTNHWMPQFPNPFDAYFYLLENFKEEEIV